MKSNRKTWARIALIAQCHRWRRHCWTIKTMVVVALFLHQAAFVQNVPAQTTHVSHSPAEVVQKYVLLDNKGARLDAASFESVAPYVEWKEEPPWGKVIVVNGFSVPDDYRKWDIITPLEVVIPVEFKVLGAVYLDTAGFVADPSVEMVRVTVKVFNNRWRITDPMFPPHVGQRRMLNFVREALQGEQKEPRRATLAALQEELRKAK